MDKATWDLLMSYGPHVVCDALGPAEALRLCGAPRGVAPAGAVASPKDAPAADKGAVEELLAVPAPGPANPYALAELVAGRTIPWDRIGDPKREVESILRAPLSALLDPKSPAGLFPKALKSAPFAGDIASRAPPIETAVGPTWARRLAARGITCGQWTLMDTDAQMRALRDAGALGDVAKSTQRLTGLFTGAFRPAGDIVQATAPVPRAEGIRAAVSAWCAGSIDCAAWDRTTVPAQDRLAGSARDPGFLAARRGACDPGTPWNGSSDPVGEYPYPTDRTAGEPWAGWFLPGPYLSRAPSVLDPRQGVVGNCVFIASLSAVAWTMPQVITTQSWTGAPPTRWSLASAPGRRTFSFYGGGVDPLDVSEQVAVAIAAAGFVFARGRDADQQWPATIEKAFASWSQRAVDRPDMWAFDWVGTAVLGDQHPIVRLTGMRCNEWSLRWSAVGNPLLPASSFVLGDGTARLGTRIEAATDDAIWTVLSHLCPDGRTRFPAVTGGIAAAPTPPPHDLVAQHAYTILGIEQRGARRYVVLRNPWGHQPATGPAVALGMWQGLKLGDGGVFALDLTVFRSYFLKIVAAAAR